MKFLTNPKLTRGVAWILFTLSLLFFSLMVLALIYGFPLSFVKHGILRAKSLRKFFEFSFLFALSGWLLHPERARISRKVTEKLKRFSQRPWAIWALSGIYFLLFFWVNVTKYLALEINFIPFLVYDYILWYFDRGRLCFTGLLHGFYHLNLILLSLYPIWKLFQSPWVLHLAGPLIVSLAAIPFFAWAKERLGDPLKALVAAFVYLNFRYVENLLHVNFAVEVFYPLFIFLAVYFASKSQDALYYGSVLLGLLVKEDSAIYFSTLGLFFLIHPSQRLRGLITCLLSGTYLVLALKVFIPMSGSNILQGDIENYPGLGSSLSELALNFVKHPWLLFSQLFLPPVKLFTFFKLTSRLLFLPFLSPWFFLVLAAIYPAFFQSYGRGDYFFQLSFYYGATVIPFLFIALVDGWKRLESKAFFKRTPLLNGCIMGGLIFLNGMNLRPLHFNMDDLLTIRLARKLDPKSVVVTQGHLLPYLGYRDWNFYVAKPYGERPDTRDAYFHPDYYLFDLEANAYPQSPEELRAMAESIRKNPGYEEIYRDHRRLLFKRKT